MKQVRPGSRVKVQRWLVDDVECTKKNNNSLNILHPPSSSSNLINVPLISERQRNTHEHINIKSDLVVRPYRQTWPMKFESGLILQQATQQNESAPYKHIGIRRVG